MLWGASGARDFGCEVIKAMVQREDSGMDQSSSTGCGSVWWNWRDILKVEMTEFGDRLAMKCENKIKAWHSKNRRDRQQKEGFGDKGFAPFRV